MRVGVFTFATDRDMAPGRFAVEVENRGFDALMFTEHSHIPVARETPYPEVYGGGVLPDFYQRTYDPFVACAFAAASTSRIRIGTAVCLLALRDAVHTAKEVASVDRLSGGRFVFGVGFGWNRDEFPTHGVDFRSRHALVEEKVAVLRALWTQEVASFDGAHLRLQPSWAWPKPVSVPHPPVLVGGNGPRSMRHAARWADGWFPTSMAGYDSPAAAVREFRELAEQAGRDPAALTVGVAPASLDETSLASYLDAGLDHVDVACVAGSDDALLTQLDDYAVLREKALS
ncbi:LLM class F420-dependent oxidoreductase [uncultured Jatrophihabitans sp.]|uniref:LLM class F420-dependent oxidoreductase n=1 Tax=uncultured Jatrophihabitans sp. TaxID=1610747 RepID=UPI0035CA69E2